MKRLEIRLLGPFEVTLDGEPVEGFESAKVWALLAYLAVESDHPLRRDQLAGLLWPDWPQKSARSNLRYALSDLRKNIGDREARPPFLLISRQSLQFNLESDAWVDVTNFEVACRQSDQEKLRAAVNLYRGGFLDDLSIDDSPPFDQWVLGRRQQLRQLAMQAFSDLVETHQHQGDLDSALKYARRQVELESWHEPAQLQLMRLLALSGQRSAALAQYEVFRKALADELDVEPSRVAQQVYAAIRDENLLELDPTSVEKDPLARLPPEPGDSPFKGLQHFEIQDAGLFFGREALTARLVAHLREICDPYQGLAPKEALNFLAIVGASGSGKSSVVRAGLIPALLNGEALSNATHPPDDCADWQVHTITPTAHPLEALAVSLTRHAERITAAAALVDDMAQDRRSLGLYAQRMFSADGHSPDHPGRLLLVVDHFEELFTLCRGEDERAAFLDNVLTAVERDGPVFVVVILRADFYAHCAEYPLLRQALSARQEYIGPMNYAELRIAIEEPAQQNGWQFEPGLVSLILRDIGASQDHPPEPGALPLLEHALLETWRRRSGRTLTLKGYQDAGGVHGAIAHTAESVFSDLPSAQQALAQRIFLRLTELGEGTQDTRRRVRMEELLSESPEAANLLRRLAEARLVTLSEDTAEVAHEALIREWPALRQWLDDDREGLRLHRRLTESAQNWAALDRAPGDLYRGARLAQIQEWAARSENAAALNDLERQFLAASQVFADQQAADRETRRRRELEAAEALANAQRQRARILSIGLALTLLLAAAALWFVRLSNINAASADRQAQVALSRQLAAQSLALQENDLYLALLLALEAQNQADTIESQASLLSALVSEPRLISYFLQFFSNLYTNDLALSPDKQILAVPSDNTAEINLYDTSYPWIVEIYSHPIPYGPRINDLVFSPDGNLLVVQTGFDFTDVCSIDIWDFSLVNEPVRLVDNLYRTECYNQAMAFHPGSTILAAGSGLPQVLFWDLTDPGEPSQIGAPLPIPIAGLEKLAFSPGGDILAAGMESGQIFFWDVSNLDSVSTLGSPVNAHALDVITLAFSLDGKLVASGSRDSLLKLWDVQDPIHPVFLSQIELGQEVVRADFSRDGGTLIAGGSDGSVYFWDIRGPANPVLQAQILPRLLGKEVDSILSEIYLYDISRDSELLASISCFERIGNERIGNEACTQTEIRMWDRAGFTAPVQVSRSLAGHTGKVFAAAFNPDGTLLASGGQDQAIRLWDDTDRLEPIPLGGPLAGHTGPVNSITFHPHEPLLASASADSTVRLWDLHDPIAPAALGDPLLGHSAEVLSVTFSPGGNLLASASADSTVVLWNTANPSAVAQLGPPLNGHSWKAASLAFNSDGSLLASGGYDSIILLWDLAEPGDPTPIGEPVIFSGGYVLSLAFSPDDQVLAAAGSFGTISLWDVSDPETPAPIGEAVRSGRNSVYSLAFSLDGKWLAAANQDGTVRLWEVSNPKQPVQIDQPLVGHTAAALTLAFSPDGGQLLSGGGDGNLVVWDVSVDSWRASACRLARRNLTRDEWQQYFSGEAYRKTCEQWPVGD